MPHFLSALPAFIPGADKEYNVQLGLYCALPASESTLLRIACASYYRLFINGQFICHGPARTAKGFFRVDEVNLAPHLTQECNHIAIEVESYHAQSFAFMKQPGFVQAEIEQNDAVIAATGKEGFTAFRLHDRVQKVERFSYQRPFSECWRLTPDTFAWHQGDLSAREKITLAPCEPKSLIDRGLPPYSFPALYPQRLLAAGTGVYDANKPIEEKRVPDVGPQAEGSYISDGYRYEDLDFILSDDIQRYAFSITDHHLPYHPKLGNFLQQGSFVIYELPYESTGFPALHIDCSKPSLVYLLMDEVLDDHDDVNPHRMNCLNVIRLELQPGEYDFVSSEIFSFRYIKVFCADGEIGAVNLRLYQLLCPVPVKAAPALKPIYDRIYQAAERTFQQNAVDFFMDCPHRERAGWLCDSFFTARSEKFFTGKNLVEECFLENFLLHDTYDDLPPGMLPMCYPADTIKGEFIPNWAMWFVLEMHDRQNRGCSDELTKRAKGHIYRLLDYFQSFINEDGLLENLENWVFVEWSKANDLVQDVNYPSNMLFAACLDAVADMYDDPTLHDRAQYIRRTIYQQSFDGHFFHDRALRREGKLVVTKECTETCQYYAFFCGVADMQRDRALWHILTTDFGPNRAQKGLWPHIYPANAFIGNYLRMDLLHQAGLHQQLLDETTDYFTYMVDKTGTLWEHITAHASCNHGFASYAAVLLQQAVEALE